MASETCISTIKNQKSEQQWKRTQKRKTLEALLTLWRRGNLFQYDYISETVFAYMFSNGGSGYTPLYVRGDVELLLLLLVLLLLLSLVCLEIFSTTSTTLKHFLFQYNQIYCFILLCSTLPFFPLSNYQLLNCLQNNICLSLWCMSLSLQLPVSLSLCYSLCLWVCLCLSVCQ